MRDLRLFTTKKENIHSDIVRGSIVEVLLMFYFSFNDKQRKELIYLLLNLRDEEFENMYEFANDLGVFTSFLFENCLYEVKGTIFSADGLFMKSLFFELVFEEYSYKNDCYSIDEDFESKIHDGKVVLFEKDDPYFGIFYDRLVELNTPLFLDLYDAYGSEETYCTAEYTVIKTKYPIKECDAKYFDSQVYIEDYYYYLLLEFEDQQAGYVETISLLDYFDKNLDFDEYNNFFKSNKLPNVFYHLNSLILDDYGCIHLVETVLSIFNSKEMIMF